VHLRTIEEEHMARPSLYATAFVVLTVTLAPVWTSRLRAHVGDRADSQQATFVGSDLFRTYCASCHGTGARGDGPLAEMLKKRPADLTVFARNNGGAFPAELVGKIIDGRQPVKGHGGKDMPVWGDAFKEASGGADEAAIKARIDALVRHVETLQAK
jgi:mono/diheme cytochrome c family protein